MYTIRTLPSPAVPSTAYCTLCRAANRAVLSSTPATVAVPYCAALQLQQRQRSLSAVVLNGGAAAATDRAPAHRPSRLHMHCHRSRNLRSGCFHSHPSPKDGLLGHPPALRWALFKFSPPLLLLQSPTTNTPPAGPTGRPRARGGWFPHKSPSEVGSSALAL